MSTEQHAQDVVVVGADGSAEGAGALRWAAAEADRHGAELLLVCALATDATILRFPDVLHQLEAAARVSLSRDQQSVAAAHPTLRTRTLIVAGRAHPELISQTDDAEMVVVGRRGHGRFASLLLGSTSLATAGNADGPVVVVPMGWQETTQAQRPIAVAVDVDHPDDAALRFAFERSRSLGQPLRVIAVFAPPETYWNVGDTPVSWETLERETGELLEKTLASYRSQFAEVEVEAIVRQGHPAQVVLELSADADLLVLGPRGKGTLGGFRVGSTTRAVLLHAKTPVAVVHTASTEDAG